MRYENDSCFSVYEEVEGASPGAEGDARSPAIPWHTLSFPAVAQPARSRWLRVLRRRLQAGGRA